MAAKATLTEYRASQAKKRNTTREHIKRIKASHTPGPETPGRWELVYNEVTGELTKVWTNWSPPEWLSNPALLPKRPPGK